MLSKEADIICRKIPSKNIVEKYRQKMFVNKLTTKFVKNISKKLVKKLTMF